MTIATAEKMYYSTKEASALLDVPYRRLLTWINEGYLPKRVFGNGYVISGADFETIVQLTHGAAVEAQHLDSEPETVGYTLQEIAEKAGISPSAARALVTDGVVQPVQEVAGRQLFDASAVEALRHAPPRSRQRKSVEDLAHVERYERGVTPLSERETHILELYGTGTTFEEIGKAMHISRQAAHALYRRALLKQRLLQEGKPLFTPATVQRRQAQPNKLEQAIFRRVLDGKSNADIAIELRQTEATVQARIRKWWKKTGKQYERIPLAAYVMELVQHEHTTA